jgi:hypothetical protein
MRPTGFGVVVLVGVVVCGIVAALASGYLRALALLVGLLVLMAVAGAGLGSGMNAGDATRKREVLSRYARPRRK